MIELRFRHALLAEGAYGMVPEAERPNAHALAARWLEEAGERAAVLAEHWERAGDGPKTVAWTAVAAAEAFSAADLAVTRGCYARLADHGAEGEAWRRVLYAHAFLCFTHGDGSEAVLVARRLVAAAEPGTASWQAGLVLLATIGLFYDPSLIPEVAARLGGRSPLALSGPGAAEINGFFGTLENFASGAEAARPFVDRALRLVADPANEPTWTDKTTATSVRAMLDLYAEDRNPTRDLYAAFPEARGSDDRGGDRRYATVLAAALGQAGQRTALRALAEVTAPRRSRGSRGLSHTYAIAHLIMCRMQSEPAAGLGDAERFLEDSRDRMANGFVGALCGQALVLDGQPERALERLHATPDLGNVQVRACLDAAEALARIAIGDRDEAAAIHDRLRASIRKTGCLPVVRTMLDEARLTLARAGREDPEPVARGAQARLERWAASVEEGAEREELWTFGLGVPSLARRVAEILV